MKLEDWAVFNGRVAGRVFGNPRFKDGESIITSPIVDIDFQTMIVQTKTNTYSLGESRASRETIYAKYEDT